MKCIQEAEHVVFFIYIFGVKPTKFPMGGGKKEHKDNNNEYDSRTD